MDSKFKDGRGYQMVVVNDSKYVTSN